jgi:effector-binding domain-containing protein
VVYASHFGPYNTIKLMYDEIGNYLKNNNITPVGNPWEEYVTDPGSVESEYLIETIVYFPIKK